MKRMLELIGVMTLCASVATCGTLGFAGGGHPFAVNQNPDGTISVTEATPWWGLIISNALTALAAGIGAVYLNNRPPPTVTRERNAP